jgi:hypothetical protein
MLSVRKWLVACAVAACFGTAGAQQGPCKDDVDKLCKDVQPGEGRIVDCLKTHKSEVSPKCSSYLKQVQAQLKQVSNACEPDMEKFCWETPIGKGGLAKCLKQHSEELSPDCKTSISKAKAAAKH